MLPKVKSYQIQRKGDHSRDRLIIGDLKNDRHNAEGQIIPDTEKGRPLA